MSPNKHKLRGPCGKYLDASERAQVMEKRIISESKMNVRKVEKRCRMLRQVRRKAGTRQHRQRTSQDKPTFALVPNTPVEEELNINSDTGVGDNDISLRRCNRIIKPPKHLGSVP